MPLYNSETTAEGISSDCSATIKNKVILITGVSPGGLGATFALAIAKHSPGILILAARDTTKAEQAAQAIAEAAPSVHTRVLALDLGSQAQIREAAKEVNGYEEKIDVLVNNAGIMAGPYRLTADGIESQFGINHIGHFLFTNLIIGKLMSTDGNQPSRVVNVSSDGYRLSPVRFDDWNFDVCLLII
jgi:NAD(P)-dependent dehydrogenase (short-subunit alcohol dehydrogenase family)